MILQELMDDDVDNILKQDRETDQQVFEHIIQIFIYL